MKNIDRYLLFSVIILGAILRLINPFQIPFMHDEFSALFRTHFSSFSELIEKGVKVDGHPAGIQVFLFYWTKFFGSSEFVVKIPFILMGIASIYLVFLIGKKWFNATTGIISASFVATLEYPIMYSQIARPYISGLFFCMLMALYWHKLVFSPEKKFYKNAILFILAGSLCTYNHHFSLLFAFIVGITGLFFIQKKYLIKYILTGLIIFILYIPHLPIFFYQLNQGGVEGWLGKPQNDFLIRHIEYIFHYSLIEYLVIIAIIILGFVKMKGRQFKATFWIISFAWFLVPFLIGFFYSKYVSAVLQSSMLIFSFPFMLYFIFGYIPDLNAKLKGLLITIILAVSILTLSVEREYYRLFYKSFYEQFMLEQDLNEKEFGNNCFSIIDSHKKISSYYLKKHELDSSFIRYDSFYSMQSFIDSLKNQKATYCYFGQHSGGNPATVSVIRDYFPNIIQQNNYFGGTSYLFSKEELEDCQKPVFYSVFDCETKKEDWSEGKQESYTSTFSHNGNYAYKIDSLQEWSPTFSHSLKDLIDDPNNFIDVSVWVLPGNPNAEILLVATIDAGNKNIHWGADKLETYITEDHPNNGWIKLHHTIKLSDTNLSHPNMTLKVFLWNRGKSNFYMDDMEIVVRKGNPVIYGLYEKI